MPGNSTEIPKTDRTKHRDRSGQRANHKCDESVATPAHNVVVDDFQIELWP